MENGYVFMHTTHYVFLFIMPMLCYYFQESRCIYSLLARMHFSYVFCIQCILYMVQCGSICEKKYSTWIRSRFYKINQHLYRKPNTCNLPFFFFCCKCNHKARHGMIVLSGNGGVVVVMIWFKGYFLKIINDNAFLYIFYTTIRVRYFNQ